MRRAVAALVVTVVAVVLLAGYDTKPPRTVNPNSALKPRPTAAPKLLPGARAAVGPAAVTSRATIALRIRTRSAR